MCECDEYVYLKIIYCYDFKYFPIESSYLKNYQIKLIKPIYFSTNIDIC